MKSILLKGTIQKFGTLADKSGKLEITTAMELAANEAADITELLQVESVIYITEGEVNKEQKIELDKMPVLEQGQKTPSERLKNVIHVYWDTCSNKNLTSYHFYEKQIEQLIEKYKEKLP